MAWRAPVCPTTAALAWAVVYLAALTPGAPTDGPRSTTASSAAPSASPAPPPSPSPWPNCTRVTPPPGRPVYSVRVTSRDPVPDYAALISHANGSSDVAFNFATAWFPTPLASSASAPGLPDGLVVRMVECNPDHHPCPNATHPEWSNAGAIGVVRASLPADGPPHAEHVSLDNVTWAGARAPPRANRSEWGAADPRIAYRESDQRYYLTWDNCTQNCYPHRTTLLSSTANPFDRDGWTLHGPLLPGVYTGGASLLFRPAPPHYAFVGNSDTANTILLAESDDGVHWARPANASRRVFMAGRPGCWDDKGVAAGPQPGRLSTGDYFYVYNIDTGFPYHPNPLGRCAIGWAVLDRDDPTRIIARSDGPLLVASLPWETCAGEGKGYRCQEPEVVFSTGLKPLGGDAFHILYGAADTDVGIATVHVAIDRAGAA